MFIVDFEANQISKEINAVQKQIAAKKKVSFVCAYTKTTSCSSPVPPSPDHHPITPSKYIA
jgi:hypothetical protein